MNYISVRLSSELYDKYLDILYLWDSEINETLERCIKYEFDHYQEMKRLSFNKFKTKDKVPKDSQKQFRITDKRYNQLLKLAKDNNISKSALIRKIMVYITNQIDGVELKRNVQDVVKK